MSHPDHQANSATEYLISRKVRMSAPELPEALLRQIESHTPGHLSLTIGDRSDELIVTYDASAHSFSQVLAWLNDAGIKPFNTWWFRVKSSLYDFTDGNVAAQSHARHKGCCNKIPKG